MKLDIVIVYVPRYVHGHATQFVPPVTGIHLAALTPPDIDVRVVHQQLDPFMGGRGHLLVRRSAAALRQRGHWRG